MTTPHLTELLYEQAKRILRATLDEGPIGYDEAEPFVLACHDCGLPFRRDVEMGMVAEHARLEHGSDVDEGALKLDLVFVGEGPPPGLPS